MLWMLSQTTSYIFFTRLKKPSGYIQYIIACLKQERKKAKEWMNEWIKKNRYCTAFKKKVWLC